MTNFSTYGTSGFANMNAAGTPTHAFFGDRFVDPTSLESTCNTSSFARSQAAIRAANEAQQQEDEDEYFGQRDFEDSIIDFDEADAMHGGTDAASNGVESSIRTLNQASSVRGQSCTPRSAYLWTPLSSAMVEEMTAEGIANGFETPPAELCAFTLIDNRLVPETFIERVKGNLANQNFDYGCVLSESCIFDAEFLDALDENERAVLMSVVLLLVSRDAFPLNLWAAQDATV